MAVRNGFDKSVVRLFLHRAINERGDWERKRKSDPEFYNHWRQAPRGLVYYISN